MSSLPIVGITISAGGLKSLKDFFRSIFKRFSGKIEAAFFARVCSWA